MRFVMEVTVLVLLAGLILSVDLTRRSIETQAILVQWYEAKLDNYDSLVAGRNACMADVTEARRRLRQARNEMQKLMELPPNEFSTTTSPPAIWQRMGQNRLLMYRPMPSRKEVRVIKMFTDPGVAPTSEEAAPTVTSTSSTTSTTQVDQSTDPNPQ